VAVSIDFGIPGQPLLQTLRFHVAAVLGIGVVLLLAGGSRWRAAIFLAILCVSLAEGGAFIYRMQAERAEALRAPHEPFLRLVSFNVLHGNTANGEAIADMVKASGADVVVLLEAGPVFPHLDSLRQEYAGHAGCEAERACDLLLLSRTPLTGIEKRSLGYFYRDRLITAQTRIGGVVVNLVAAHLVKPYFDSAAVVEAQELERILGRLEGPLLLAGDFNAAPWSDTIEGLTREADLLAGPSYPATWPVFLGPLGVPIDNIFTRRPLVIDKVEALEAMGSNHRGLAADIVIAR
jgi:endonuclease/exonuclease/phosphatase (EEP) superfamily protein YafD